ncbi:MAG: MASE1 domain-containing protein [Acidobacteriota bacterium]|nr:MASE1 domain-containing protein [Acidobacteriota bacterium]
MALGRGHTLGTPSLDHQHGLLDAGPDPQVRTAGAGARHVSGAVLVVVAYVVAAKLGLHLAFANKNVTAVWPPTGIAVAALLLLGVRVWPSIAVGALLANLANGAGLDTSMLITVGNTAAPVLAWFLIHRVARAQKRLERVPDVVKVLLLGGPLSMTVSAFLGTAALAATTTLPWSDYGSTWFTWWIGDAMGVVIVTPLILVAAARSWRSCRFHGWNGVEALAAAVCIVGTTAVVFSRSQDLIFLVLPLTTWAAVRFFQLGAATAVGVVSALSITATVGGHGPLVHGLSTTGSLITLQVFNGALALSTFMLAAAQVQHARARAALQADADDLAALLMSERRAALDDMTAVISHDLRTPLSTIANSHYLLREMIGDRLDEHAALALDVAERAQAQAAALTEQVLALRRPRNLVLAEIDLAHALVQAAETTPVPPGVVLRTDCAPIRVRVDPGQLRQILTNLISNGCEAMGGDGELHLFGRVDGETVIVGAADSGPGFAPDVADRAFEPFFSTKPSGTGLGLAIVQRLAEAHGGRVRLENRPAGGAVVSISLPRVLAGWRR